MENPAVDRAGVIEAVVWKNNQKEIARTTIDVSEIDNGFSWKIIFAEKETMKITLRNYYVPTILL